MMRPYFLEAARWASLPYRWGWADCVTCPADWVLRCAGQDPMQDLRGTYESFSEAERAYRFFSNPMAVAGVRLDAILTRTDAPVGGDVGFVHLPLDARPMPHGALCLGDVRGVPLWVVRSPNGVLQVQAPKVLISWRVPECA